MDRERCMQSCLCRVTWCPDLPECIYQFPQRLYVSLPVRDVAAAAVYQVIDEDDADISRRRPRLRRDWTQRSNVEPAKWTVSINRQATAATNERCFRWSPFCIVSCICKTHTLRYKLPFNLLTNFTYFISTLDLSLRYPTKHILVSGTKRCFIECNTYLILLRCCG